jgi:hypothetical protein
MRLFFLFGLALIIGSCTKLSTETPIPVDNPKVYNDNPIMFCGLAVGQQSAYILLEGSQYNNNNVLDDFIYVNDTLIVEVIAEDENGFLVKEYLTEGSAPLPMGVYQIPDSTFQYYLKIENDSLKYFDPDAEYGLNSLLFWYSSGALALDLYDNQEATIEGWKTSLPYCECNQTGYAPIYELFGVTYEDLNISIRNTDMQVDGPGTTYIYSNLYGMVKSSHYSWWTATGFGWDLVSSE